MKHYQPGTYTGRAQGFGGTVTVSVTVDEEHILSVIPDVSTETAALAARPAAELPAAILAAGGVEVDGISGATVTSDAIKRACADALKQASGGEADPCPGRPGHYTASARGYEGEILVETELNESGIAGVRILKARETPGLGREGAEEMARRITDAGSLAVDGVSGATVTSSAVRQAASFCIQKAGGDSAAYSAAPAPAEKEPCVLETDVAVVGAGIAGLCAAIEALEQGARVLLLEKLDLIGGTAIVAGGAFMAADSYLNAGPVSEAEELAQWLYERQERHYNVSLAQLRHVAHRSGELIAWIRERSGVEFQLGYGGGSPKQWSHRPVLRPEEPRNGHGTPRIIHGLADWFCRKGGVLLTGTRAAELLTDETGAVTGLLAESREKCYTVHAQGGVVIAAGGYELDPELTARLAPNSVHMISNGRTAGDTGDGIRMGETAGAQLTYSGYLMGSWNHLDGLWAFGLDAMGMKHKVPCIEVNGRMERFYNENTDPIREKWEFAKDGTGEFYVLFDSSLPEELRSKLDRAAEAGAILRGESAGALAEQIGKSPLALESTLAHWNAMAAEGADSQFGNELIAPLRQAPYYLCRVSEMSTGSYGGLKISLHAQVLRPDGTPIPGLYAAGESANGEFYYRNYVCGGSSFSMCGVFGREAGAHAARRAGGES